VRCAQSYKRSYLVVAVHVTTYYRAFNLDDATNGDVFTDLLNQRFTLGFQIAFHQLGNVSFALLESNVQNVVGKVHEVVVTSNEVSLGVHFQNVGNGVVVRHFYRRHAFSSGTASLLGGLQAAR